jgi:hypothetical protein
LAEQLLPQAPQLLASVFVSTHTLLQTVGLFAGHGPQAPETHASPRAHWWPQEPQLFGSVDTFTHLPEQIMEPELQTELHFPPAQIAVAFAGAGQTLPQAPQLLTLLVRSTQLPPHLVVLAGQVCAAAQLQTH